jgi:hypothetical protein
MPRISRGAKAGMIGGVRSPMATPSHGLVAKGKLKPSVAANTTRPGIAKKSAPIRSPQTAGHCVSF